MKTFRSAFTLTEVALVLALGGMIFGMVFMAVPALMRNSRDTDRKDDLSSFITAVNEYKTNNNGALPFANGVFDESFVHDYVDNTCTSVVKSTANTRAEYGRFTFSGCKNFEDPDGVIYMIDYGYGASLYPVNAERSDAVYAKATSLDTASNNVKHVIFVATSSKCGAVEDHLIGTENKNNFALLYGLENGSVYCLDNQ